MIERLTDRSCWIFDLDGTLTLPVHDFAYIRRELAIPAGADILGHLDSLPPEEAFLHHRRLDDIERSLAERAEAAAGVPELLGMLDRLGIHMGVLTRNSREIALLTLEAIGVNNFFLAEHVLGRDEAPPKPDPAGILHLLDLWSTGSQCSVMVGDYLFDLQAGRAAGAVTVHVGRPDGQRWPKESDIMVADLAELVSLLA
jgi:phosphoglycolate phosphatase-like HAD superfamily hydrolase